MEVQFVCISFINKVRTCVCVCVCGLFYNSFLEKSLSHGQLLFKSLLLETKCSIFVLSLPCEKKACPLIGQHVEVCPKMCSQMRIHFDLTPVPWTSCSSHFVRYICFKWEFLCLAHSPDLLNTNLFNRQIIKYVRWTCECSHSIICQTT